MSTTSHALHEAALLHEQGALMVVHDWRAFLEARAALLDLPPDADDPFERGGAAQARADAEACLAGIPSDRRALFDRAVAVRREQRRAQIEGDLVAEPGGAPRIADPELVDRAVLRELLTEAVEPDISGHILFPESDEGGQLIWLEYCASALEARPDAAAYRMGARAQPGRDARLRMAGGALALALTGLAIWMLLAPEGAAMPIGERLILVNGQPAQPWRVTRVMLAGAALDVGAAPGQGWPSDGAAHVRESGGLPLQLCVPSAALRGAQELRVVGDGATPERLYQLGASGGSPDVVVAACDDPAVVVAGSLIAAQVASPAGVGEAQQLGGRRVTLSAVGVAGPAEDPAIPPGAARVALRLAADAPVEWGGCASALRLGDGTEQMAPELRVGAGGEVELRFLVAAPPAPMLAELRLTDAASRQVARWRLDLAPPPGREAVLGARLRVESVAGDGGGRILVRVVNLGDEALALYGADVRLGWDGAEMPLSDVSGLGAALAPGEARELGITLPPDLRGEATLSIGGQRYRIVR